MKVYSTDVTKAFLTRERCQIIEILNDPSFPHLSLAQAIVAPGVTTELHSLKSTLEYYYITEGKGIMQVGENRAEVSKGDCIPIQPNQAQCIENTGSEDLVFLCICHPSFETNNYKAL